MRSESLRVCECQLRDFLPGYIRSPRLVKLPPRYPLNVALHQHSTLQANIAVWLAWSPSLPDTLSIMAPYHHRTVQANTAVWRGRRREIDTPCSRPFTDSDSLQTQPFETFFLKQKKIKTL